MLTLAVIRTPERVLDLDAREAGIDLDALVARARATEC
jgi:hypothetical protein